MKNSSNSKKRTKLLLDREIVALLSPKQLTAMGGVKTQPVITLTSDDIICTLTMSENQSGCY
jgi:hypothetical protein